MYVLLVTTVRNPVVELLFLCLLGDNMPNVPTDIKLIREENILEITWPTQPPMRYDMQQLRCACPCAHCVDEMTGIRTLAVDTVPVDISITDMELVGNYAIKFTFSDGHDTGIFHWDRLDDLSPIL